MHVTLSPYGGTPNEVITTTQKALVRATVENEKGRGRERSQEKQAGAVFRYLCLVFLATSLSVLEKAEETQFFSK